VQLNVPVTLAEPCPVVVNDEPGIKSVFAYINTTAFGLFDFEFKSKLKLLPGQTSMASPRALVETIVPPSIEDTAASTESILGGGALQGSTETCTSLYT